VGVRAAQVVDFLITIGNRARTIAESALTSGLSKVQVIELDGAAEAIDYLQNHLTAGDIVLVKGSRGMRMDQIVSVLEIQS